MVRKRLKTNVVLTVHTVAVRLYRIRCSSSKTSSISLPLRWPVPTATSELVRREAPAALAATRRSRPRAASLDESLPYVGPSIRAEELSTGILMGSASQGRSCSQPRGSMPTSRRLPPLPSRPSTDRDGVQAVLCESEGLLNAQPGTPEQDPQSSKTGAMGTGAGLMHGRDDL